MGEVHQAAAISPVDAVVANTEEASKMIETTNKILAAFLYHVMREWDMDEEFIKRLLSKAVNPKLVADINNCTWDKKTQTLCTPGDEENKKQKSIDDSAWYNNDFISQLTTKGKKKKFMAKENIFQLDDEHSYKTLNEKPWAYEGSPGGEVFHVAGRNMSEAVECSRDKEDDINVVSAASGTSTRSKAFTPSREELLEMMKNANISIEELKKGSVPKSHGKSRGESSGEQ